MTPTQIEAFTPEEMGVGSGCKNCRPITHKSELRVFNKPRRKLWNRWQLMIGTNMLQECSFTCCYCLRRIKFVEVDDSLFKEEYPQCQD